MELISGNLLVSTQVKRFSTHDVIPTTICRNFNDYVKSQTRYYDILILLSGTIHYNQYEYWTIPIYECDYTDISIFYQNHSTTFTNYTCKHEYIAKSTVECLYVSLQTINAPALKLTDFRSQLTDIAALEDYTLIKWVPDFFLKMFTNMTLYPLIGPQPIFGNIDYCLRGPHKCILTIVKANPGQGAPYHQHRYGQESFYILKGRFEITIDEENFILEAHDHLTVATGSFRKFTNIDQDIGYIMPIVLGVDDESTDIIFDDTILKNISQNSYISTDWWRYGLSWLNINFHNSQNSRTSTIHI